MQNVSERERHASPGPRPQPLAFYGDTLWVGCWDNSHLYALDTTTWSVLDEVAAPGQPFGMVAFDGAMRVVLSDEEDDRFLYRFSPGHGFDLDSKTPCPEHSGSHLASDGKLLYLLQMGKQKILALDASASVQREIALPTRCGGISFGPGGLWMISADEEFDELHLATVDLSKDRAGISQVASITADARALAFSGSTGWTSLRELSEILSFTAPAAGVP